MALVSASGMGEAVLGYGDGIASKVVSRGQDGGVFAANAELKTEVAVPKGIRLDRDATQQNGALEPSSKGRQGVIMEAVSLREDASNENGAAIGGRFAQPAPPVNGGVDVEWNELSEELEGGGLREGDGEGEETVVKCNGEMEAGAAINGGSHAANSGCRDGLVEMVIQCLDEKVHFILLQN